MDEATRRPTPAEAQELLAKAESLAAVSINAAGWPVALIFTSLAILGSMLMVGLQIVSHTGYGAPLLAGAVGFWAAATACIWPLFQTSSKVGFPKRFVTSLIAYMSCYVVAVVVGASVFGEGNLWYYLSAAVALAGVGLAAAFRELRA